MLGGAVYTLCLAGPNSSVEPEVEDRRKYRSTRLKMMARYVALMKRPGPDVYRS